MIWDNEYSKRWRRRFALFPASINGGRTVWLSFFMERFVEYNGGKGCAYCGSGFIGKWERKLPAEITI